MSVTINQSIPIIFTSYGLGRNCYGRWGKITNKAWQGIRDESMISPYRWPIHMKPLECEWK